jgi:hypothetical protein
LIYCFDPGNPKSYPGSGTTVFELTKTKTSANGTLIASPTHSFNSGGHFTFDGTNQYIDVVDSYKSSISSFTMDMWFKQVGSNSTSQYLMSIVDTLDENISATFYYSQPLSSYGISLANNYDNLQVYDYGLPLAGRAGNGWNNIIVSVAESGGTFVTVTYCVNGVYGPATLLFDEWAWGGISPSNIYIGSFALPSPLRWNGQIGPTKLYNRILNQQEMLQNFNAHRQRYGV